MIAIYCAIQSRKCCALVELTGIEPVASSSRTRQSLKLNGALTASYKPVWSNLGPINPARLFASFAHSSRASARDKYHELSLRDTGVNVQFAAKSMTLDVTSVHAIWGAILLAALVSYGTNQHASQKTPSNAASGCELAEDDYAIYTALMNVLGGPEDPNEPSKAEELVIVDVTEGAAEDSEPSDLQKRDFDLELRHKLADTDRWSGWAPPSKPMAMPNDETIADDDLDFLTPRACMSVLTSTVATGQCSRLSA